MLRFVIRKMLSKKWMVIALLIGNILLVAITASNPMYTEAVLQRTLDTRFDDALASTNRFPMTATLRVTPMIRSNDLIPGYDERIQTLASEFGLPQVELVTHLSLQSVNTQSSLDRDDRSNATISLGALSDMADHITLIAGTGPSAAPDDDGVIDVIVSERGVNNLGLIMGEVLTFPRYPGPDGEPVRVRVAGVFKNSAPDDPYWVQSPLTMGSELFMDEALFREWFLKDNEAVGVSALWYVLMDYQVMRVDQIQHVLDTSAALQAEFDEAPYIVYVPAFTALLTAFQSTEKKVRTTMWVLQTPIFVLLAAFIFMVSRQMLENEQAEIAVLKSRGAGRAQIIATYLIQSLLIAALSLAAGLPLGVLLVQVLGSANAFLEFVRRGALKVILDRSALMYALAAALLSVVAMLLPALKYSRLSIVNQKQRKHRHSDAPLWQKLFLDVLTLGLSLYGLYSFNNQREYLATQVLDGASMDPLLFLSSSLFMIGAGLVAVRLMPALVWLCFTLFKRWWSPALYAAFLRVLRERHKQGFIMVFLIMTIALGVFDASAARTINQNDEQNLRYMSGADIVLQERWSDNSALAQNDPSVELEYVEPDYGRYAELDGAQAITRVLVDQNGTMTVPGGTLKNIRIMGINTREFGQTAWFDTSLLPQHWYHYLNAMSQKARAVLVSSNFARNYGYKIGDVIYYRTGSKDSVRGVIYGFVDYWPTYAPTVYARTSDGLYTEQENYLIVANFSQLQAAWGVTPYQIWIKAGDSSQFIYDFANETDTFFTKFDVAAANLVRLKNDPVIQGTNGVLTVGFIVVLVLCAVGFMIYWVLSIKSRALQFGIFRAMGMTMREIVTMLIGEHLFISGGSILTGALVGHLTARLYMPLIQIAYSSSENALPLRVVSLQSDNIRLAIIITLMIGVCMAALGVLISRMKIAQALKLGED